MNWLDDVLRFLKDQGPALAILIIAYMNGRAIRAQNLVNMQKLQDQIKENHGDVIKMFSGMSDSDIVDSAAGPDDPNLQPAPTSPVSGSDPKG